MSYELETCMRFLDRCIMSGNELQAGVYVYSTCDDDGYSYCPSYPMIGFRYFVPVLGWQHFESFYPREIFNSEYFEVIWDLLPEIKEDICHYGKHAAFDDLIKESNTHLEKLADETEKNVLEKLKTFTPKELNYLEKYIKKGEC